MRPEPLKRIRHLLERQEYRQAWNVSELAYSADAMAANAQTVQDLSTQVRDLVFNPMELVEDHFKLIKNLGNEELHSWGEIDSSMDTFMRTNILKSFMASKVPALQSVCRWVEVTREPLTALKYRLKESEVRDFLCAPEYKNISDPPTRSKRSLHDINVWVNTLHCKY